MAEEDIEQRFTQVFDTSESDPEEPDDQEDTQEEAQREVLQRRAIERWENTMEDVGIPPRFQEAHISGNCQWMKTDDEKKLAWSVATSFATPTEEGRHHYVQNGVKRRSLLLSGGFGTGKTWLATAVFKAILWQKKEVMDNQRMTALWRRFPQFIGECQSTYSPSADETLQEVLNRYQQTDLLLLDDLGDLQKSVEYTDRRELLSRVINTRNDYFLPTLMTTNLGVEELKEQFGERTFDRMKEMAAFVKMEGKNLRDHPPPPAKRTEP